MNANDSPKVWSEVISKGNVLFVNGPMKTYEGRIASIKRIEKDEKHQIIFKLSDVKRKSSVFGSEWEEDYNRESVTFAVNIKEVRKLKLCSEKEVFACSFTVFFKKGIISYIVR